MKTKGFENDSDCCYNLTEFPHCKYDSREVERVWVASTDSSKPSPQGTGALSTPLRQRRRRRGAAAVSAAASGAAALGGDRGVNQVTMSTSHPTPSRPELMRHKPKWLRSAVSIYQKTNEVITG